VVQNSNQSFYLSSGYYRINLPIPKCIFNKYYPQKAVNFGDKLRTMRIDVGLQIKDLAQILMVTADTIINWEKRGITPTTRNLKKVMQWINRSLN
jgi:DNA-binding XRE family transcriptional regulator